MTNEIEQLVVEYKDKLDKAGATFLLVYAYKNPISDQNVCQIVSNSGKEGIRAILHAILQPTKTGLELIAQALTSSAMAAVGVLPAALIEAQAAGAFATAARNLFEALRPHWTIKGWEKETLVKPS